MTIINKKDYIPDTITTERLLIRNLQSEDADDMFDYTSNPNVVTHLSWSVHSNINETKNYIEKVLGENNRDVGSYTWGIELSENNKLIGALRVFDISLFNKRCEISYIINPRFQKKGYATEVLVALISALRNYGFNRIQARCAADNIASEKVLQKIGMSYEGTLKQYWLIQGYLQDANLYAICFQKK